jgi:hypothetical protein
VPSLGARRGYGLAAFFYLRVNRGVPLVRTAGLSGGKSSKRVQGGEPNLIRLASRYLIDFIAGILDISSGLAPPDSDPGVDSNSLSDEPTPKRIGGPPGVLISEWPTSSQNSTLPVRPFQ